jgi:outer membrane protein
MSCEVPSLMRSLQTMKRLFVSFVWLTVLLSPVLHAQNMALTEEKVLEIALKQNLGIHVARLDSQIGRSSIGEAHSLFDTVLEAEIDYLLDKSDRSNTLAGTDNRSHRYNLGISKAFISGTKARLDWNNQKDSTNSIFTTLNPAYSSVLGLRVEQALLNNFFGLQDRGLLRVAKTQFEATDAVTQRRISEEIYQILSYYWDFVTTVDNVKISQKSLREARRFEKIAAQKQSLGLFESTDVLAAKANRLEMENHLLDAVTEKDNGHGRLLRSLNLSEGLSLTTQEKISIEELNGTREQSLKKAMNTRTDLIAAKRNLDANKVSLALAKNNRWPELDLVASLALNGVESDYGDALSKIGQADHTNFFIGAQFKMPLENRYARSGAKRAGHEKMKALYELRILENTIAQEIDEQWRNSQAWHKKVNSYKKIQNLQYKKWQEELRKYRNGRSSSDLVIRFQEDYLQAQRVTLSALFQYRMSVLGLRLAENTLVP